MSRSLQEIIDANPEAETFRFGDSKALSDEILGLVRSGVKTATCEAARHYGENGDAWPVSTRRWSEMDADFVAAQGEFRDLAHWRDAYRAYFERTGGWSEDMKIMCERFRVVEDYAEKQP